MIRSVITGMGRYFPERVVTSEEVEEMANYKKLGVKIGLCRMLTGCEVRHYAAEKEYSSDIAARAGAEAMKNAGIEPGDVDALLFCSVTHDFAEPATANVVADKLNVRNAFVFDIKNACNAFLSGVDIADSFIKTGKAETVLVVSGEAFSKWMKFDYDSKEELINRAPVALSLGDGGGAFVVQKKETDDVVGIDRSYFHTYSQYWNNNVVWGGGVMYPKDADKLYVPGTTKQIADVQKEVYLNMIPKMKDMFGMSFEDVDCIVPTQVAKWAVNTFAEMVSTIDNKPASLYHDKTISVVDRYGNVGAANVPIAAVEAVENNLLKPGSTAFFISVGVGISEAIMSVRF